MLKVYGTLLCPDCVECCADLDRAGICYAFLDFTKDLIYLKEFLAIRDGSSVFDAARAEGKIGIPCILRENGTITLDWEEFM